MIDQIETFGSSLIHHGHSNARVYLMKIDPDDCPAVIDYAAHLAHGRGYSKIFAKAPAVCQRGFVEKGFIEEARVPQLFNGSDDGYFLSCYVDHRRGEEQQSQTLQQVLEVAHNEYRPHVGAVTLAGNLSWKIMAAPDVVAMAQLYRRVFASYPFPIDDPAYLLETMAQGVIYHGICNGDGLIALSSAEVDWQNSHVEMTDFATHPDHRGQGLATFLLARMEEDLSQRGICTAYTIARAYSYGMNITFARHGYQFAGTLTNNTQIFGQLESMNVWYKALADR